MLKNKKILLGISGSIAAYKSIFLTRELKKLGAEVKVILTDSALAFVTPITLSTLSENPVYSSFIKNENSGEWVNHVELGKWADLFIVAPASANTLSKLATGNCDNLLVATYLSATCTKVLAPAMDLDMYAHITTQRNLERLKSDGVEIIDSEEGSLASGLTGKGRMAEPEHIIEKIQDLIGIEQSLLGRKVLVSAGPTYEAIDPVRFIGNHSSGKMGYRIAEEFSRRGAIVTLVSGPSSESVSENVDKVDVVSASEMYDAMTKRFGDSEIVVMSAAVADFKPAQVSSQKIKKNQGNHSQIALEPTIDILKELGSNKKAQILVGFALETENELSNGKDKLKKKNLDLLVLNSLNDKGAGFGGDTNKISILTSSNVQSFDLKSKMAVAKDIVDAIEGLA